MLCEQVLGKLHDFDITGKTIEYVDIEWTYSIVFPVISKS